MSEGKWCPCNPDGSDHWDLCREMAIKKGLKKPGKNSHSYPYKQHGKYPFIPVDCPAPPFVVWSVND